MKSFEVSRNKKDAYLEFDQLTEEEQEDVLWKLLIREESNTYFSADRGIEDQVRYLRKVVVGLVIALYQKGKIGDKTMESLLTKAENGW